jgi:recombination protein RecA
MPKKAKKSLDFDDVSADFGFFKQEIEADGVSVVSAAEIVDPECNFSGSYNLDFDLTIPFPEGRIVEVFGDEGSCKTTLTLEVAGQACQRGKVVLYVNMEKSLNLSLMQTIRPLRPFLDKALERLRNNKDFDPNDCPLWIVRASTGEQALEAIRKFAAMFPGGITILDSIDATQPEAVLSGNIGDRKVGNLPQLMSDAMRKLIDVAEKNNVCMIFINQIREKIGVMYGDPRETSGGRAMKFYASQRIQLMKPGKAQIFTDADGNKIGVIVRYKIIKNKVAPDGQEGEFPILLKNGIFREQEIISQCLDFGILKFGGRGGKQVLLPTIDRDTGKFVEQDGELQTVAMRQFNASLRLLMDTTLCSKLEEELRRFLNNQDDDVVDNLVNEISNSQQS